MCQTFFVPKECFSHLIQSFRERVRHFVPKTSSETLSAPPFNESCYGARYLDKLAPVAQLAPVAAPVTHLAPPVAPPVTHLAAPIAPPVTQLLTLPVAEPVAAPMTQLAEPVTALATAEVTAVAIPTE